MPAGYFREVGPLRLGDRSSDNPEIKTDSGDTAGTATEQVLIQLAGIGAAWGLVGVGAFVVIKILHLFVDSSPVVNEERKPVPVSA